MMDATHLTGLEGLNPLGFLAALGVQVLFVDEVDQPRLWWTEDVVPHAVVDGAFPVERIIKQALGVFPKWAESPALVPGFGGKAAKTGKFEPADIRRYLKYSLSDKAGWSFPAALVAEGSLDSTSGVVAKPSDLYFTSGPQCFLEMARSILGGVTEEDLVEGLLGPWRYQSKLPTLMWDISDDRNYALLAEKPTPGNKYTNPGPEALAILGISRLSVFGQSGRTLTLGCDGTWNRGSYSWPLWLAPSGYGAVDGFLAHATVAGPRLSFQRDQWYRSWSISRVLTAEIRRFGQGYGSFMPPRTVWWAA